ncbi:MAG: hypothetical protein JWL83_2185 [Actinomycetia bacterium]|nr:hypothetical protein [Actinomycetes bacterium]
MSATAFAGSANAITGTAKGDTINYKYAGVTGPDSSTCGGDWANDKETRTFKVYPERSNNGTYQVTETFTGGKFTTVAGPSPESCEAGTSNTLAAGLKGTFHGYITMYVSNTDKLGDWSASTDVTCSATCTTTEWVANAFGPTATLTEPDWWFTYKTTNPSACASHWINANYGNSGDIATSCGVGI